MAEQDLTTEAAADDWRASYAERRAALLRDATKDKLAETIRELDRCCIDYAERIEALAHGTKALLAAEANALRPWRSLQLAKLLEMIIDTSAELSNTVNSDAENVGCNHFGAARGLA